MGDHAAGLHVREPALDLRHRALALGIIARGAWLLGGLGLGHAGIVAAVLASVQRARAVQ